MNELRFDEASIQSSTMTVMRLAAVRRAINIKNC
jgi:hypothetical protein